MSRHMLSLSHEGSVLKVEMVDEIRSLTAVKTVAY
jgi:hypothetical protein